MDYRFKSMENQNGYTQQESMVRHQMWEDINILKNDVHKLKNAINHIQEFLQKAFPHVDYDKLRDIHRMTEAIPYGLVTIRHSLHDGTNYYFECPRELDIFKFYTEDIDELIAKLRELTKSESKYKIGQTRDDDISNHIDKKCEHESNGQTHNPEFPYQNGSLYFKCKHCGEFYR